MRNDHRASLVLVVVVVVVVVVVAVQHPRRLGLTPGGLKPRLVTKRRRCLSSGIVSPTTHGHSIPRPSSTFDCGGTWTEATRRPI